LPLFSTSLLLSDCLSYNNRLGAKQVIVDPTSPRNADLVHSLGTCNGVITYDHIGSLDGTAPCASVEMSGAGEAIAAIHAKFGEKATPPHAVFIAPGQSPKCEQDCGPGEGVPPAAIRYAAKRAAAAFARAKSPSLSGVRIVG